MLFIVILALFSSGAFAQNFDLINLNFDRYKVVAAIDTLTITAGEYYLSYELGPAFIRKNKYAKERHLEFMINEKLLALDGYERNIDKKEDISILIDEYKYDLATEKFFIDSILSIIEIEDKEIEEVLSKKQTFVEIRWFFTTSEEEIKGIFKAVNSGTSFDSIYAAQLNDSIVSEDRYLRTNIFQLEKKNPLLAEVIMSLKVGEISPALHVMDGWYLIELMNIEKNILTTESEYNRIKQEAINAITKNKMDKHSDQYVQELINKNNPIIKKDAFKFVLSYLGKYFLPANKYNEWQLGTKRDEAVLVLGNDVNDSVLVSMDEEICIRDFLNWFRFRSNYIKLDKNSYNDFARNVEISIWLMVRDKLLTNTAIKHGYDQYLEVNEQISWWKDKIVGSAVRNEILNSVQLEIVEPDNVVKDNYSDPENTQAIYQKKLLHKILSLKNKYHIQVNTDVLNAIPVSVEYDPAAIEFLAIKNGGLIPRTPYPTINHEWINWE